MPKCDVCIWISVLLCTEPSFQPNSSHFIRCHSFWSWERNLLNGSVLGTLEQMIFICDWISKNGPGLPFLLLVYMSSIGLLHKTHFSTKLLTWQLMVIGLGVPGHKAHRPSHFYWWQSKSTAIVTEVHLLISGKWCNLIFQWVECWFRMAMAGPRNLETSVGGTGPHLHDASLLFWSLLWASFLSESHDFNFSSLIRNSWCHTKTFTK